MSTIKQFILKPVDNFLEKSTVAYFSFDYNKDEWDQKGTVEYKIWCLKGDSGKPYTVNDIHSASRYIKNTLIVSLPQIWLQERKENLVVCIVPRAKIIEEYDDLQLSFKKAVKEALKILETLINL